MATASEIVEARGEQPLDVVVGLIPGSKAVYVVAPRKTSMVKWAEAMAKRMKEEGAVEWAAKNAREFTHWLMQSRHATIYRLAANPGGQDMLYIYSKGKTAPIDAEINQFLKKNGMGADTEVKMISDVRREEASSSQSTIRDVFRAPPATKEQRAAVGQPEDDEPEQSKMSPERISKMLGKSSHSRQDVNTLRRGFWNPEKGSLPSDLDPQMSDKIVDILLQNQ